MIDIALNIALLAVAGAVVLCAWRMLMGPSAPDRVLALDTLYINVVGLVVLMGIRLGSGMVFEAALIVALLGFVGTVALSRYLTRGDVIE